MGKQKTFKIIEIPHNPRAGDKIVVEELLSEEKKCPSDECTCDYCTDDRQEIASLPETKETLEEKIAPILMLGKLPSADVDQEVKIVAQIALDHFKENPFELGYPGTTGEVFRDYFRKHPEEIGCVSKSRHDGCVKLMESAIQDHKKMEDKMEAVQEIVARYPVPCTEPTWEVWERRKKEIDDAMSKDEVLNKGMVSHEKVMEVFDSHTKHITVMNKNVNDLVFLRTALQNMEVK